ncbi:MULTISPECIES: HlyU family transcriptional regulator [Zymobacter]|uniref:Uncharacterized conserved protein n=1 Tax=Zymobacter palmae TaxID=33074 RepID=A0A348HDP0_9GAMM|nr:HlyU family transcriptional regulator [Zymobacter palmae]BBG29742.1 uncharacterized conserved protein [Zymobacter palmae]
MLKWLKRILGGTESAAGSKKPQEAEPLRYQGCDIVAAPVEQNGQYRISGTIRQPPEEDGDLSIPFDRADTFPDRETAIRMTQLKARQFIDEQETPLF